MNKMTEKQKYDFVMFVLPHLPLNEFSGMKCSVAVNESWGIYIDYHVYSDVLDYMYTIGQMVIVGYTPDGMTIYSLVH